jgi:RNA polymerase I-specific transcription initiation factor RRN6
VIPENSQLPLDHKRLNVGNLLKAHPEFVPAKEIISQFVKTTEAERVEFREITGDVVVIGYAHARPRPIRIIALPCGEAGHILKLVKLRNEALAWEHRHGPSISPDSLETSEQGFWMSAGGVIRQIAVCDDGLEASPWLAVRQDSLVTIFRPAFDQVALAAKEVTARRFPLSRLNAHPVASLTRASHGSEKYVDMSFNPWYTRQFIAIDILGQWSIWSVGGKPHSSVTLPLVAGKSGNIKDAYEMNSLPGIPAPVRQDGWYRALWISNLSTIVIIGRREIVVFDIKARPKRLRSLQLRSERILDAKRSPADHSHLFVLTTSRVLWVKVAPSGHKESEDHGASIILSQRHFRDSSDASLKLCMLNRAPGTLN